MLNNLIGKTFGRLKVIDHFGINKFKQHLWVCRCDCGVIKNILGRTLNNGRSKSCGCLHNEIIAAIGHANKKHGEGSHTRNTREYHSWSGDRKSTRLNSSHIQKSRMPSSA